MEETKITQEAIDEELNSKESVAVESEVSEGCGCKEECEAKKEPEDNEGEKKVEVKEGIEAEHKAKQEKEVAKEQAKDLMEQLLDSASLKVAKIVEAAMAEAPITEGMSEEEIEKVQEGIMEDGKKLLSNVMSVLEEIIAGSALDLNGHEATIIDFVGKGGKVNASLPAGINPPVKHEENEHEKSVHIKEEVDYKSLYAESEAVMNELVEMVEQTSEKYKSLVESYNVVSTELKAYKLVESYGISVSEGLGLLADYEYDAIVEEFEKQIAASSISEEKEEPKAEEDKKEEAEEKVEEKTEVKEEKEEPKAEEEKEEPKAEEKVEEKTEVKEEKEPEEAKEKVEEIIAKVEEEPKAEEDKKEEPKAEEKTEVKEEKEEAEEDKKEEAEEIKESLKEVEGEVISESVAPVAPVRKAFSVFSSEVISESKARKAYSVFAD